MAAIGTFLTGKKAKRRGLPVIGRQHVIDQVVTTLSRVTRSNPLLLGHPGVGKTAIVQGLAERIDAGQVPKDLAGSRILEIAPADLVAGTAKRGALEERVQKLIAGLDENTILFIDEVHSLLGASQTAGAVGIADALKPALADGSIRLIAATTIAEYRTYLEKDAAFARRFRPITVTEPSADETANILDGIRLRLETQHGVLIADEALAAAQALSDRYLVDRCQPDKAIDVLDEACAKARTAGDGEAPTALQELLELRAEHNKALNRGDLAAVSKMEYGAIPAAEAKIATQRTLDPQVTDAQITGVVADWAGIPSSIITQSDNDRLQSLHRACVGDIFGQDAALASIQSVLAKSVLGLSARQATLGSVLLYGPTGTGKTSLAKAIAKGFFGDERSLIRIDGTEFSEEHSVAKLIGAPPGYTGYDQAGRLTEAIRTKPFAVLLIDEADKAHPAIWDILLTLIDEGLVPDGHGREYRAHGLFVVLTTNLTEESARANFFRPELRARMDAEVALPALSTAALAQIAAHDLQGFCQRAQAAGFQLDVDPKDAEAIARATVEALQADSPLSARSLSTYIEENLTALVVQRNDWRGTRRSLQLANNQPPWTVIELQ